jgi:hypothetical protein
MILFFWSLLKDLGIEQKDVTVSNQRVKHVTWISKSLISFKSLGVGHVHWKFIALNAADNQILFRLWEG